MRQTLLDSCVPSSSCFVMCQSLRLHLQLFLSCSHSMKHFTQESYRPCPPLAPLAPRVTNNNKAGVCIAGSTLNHWPFPWNHLGEAHAYQLTHCGTPCVFYDHFMNADLQKQIKALLKIRKRHGISNRSKVMYHVRPFLHGKRFGCRSLGGRLPRKVLLQWCALSRVRSRSITNQECSSYIVSVSLGTCRFLCTKRPMMCTPPALTRRLLSKLDLATGPPRMAACR